MKMEWCDTCMNYTGDCEHAMNIHGGRSLSQPVEAPKQPKRIRGPALPSEHPDSDVRSAFIRLSDMLTQWERNTGRRSVLIFREVEAPGKSFGVRLMDGKPWTVDTTDEELLKFFVENVENA